MDIEGEGNALMDTDSQPMRLLSQMKLSKTNKDVAYKLVTNKWWPFDRVDGRLLEQLNKQQSNQRRNEYENAPF